MGEPRDTAEQIQDLAEHFAVTGHADRATRLHGLAREVARELDTARLIANSVFYCMFCKAVRRDPPATGCEMPYEHARPDGSRYVEPPAAPPISLRCAAEALREEFYGLPWFADCVHDDARGVLVIKARGPVPEGAAPSLWLGKLVEVSRG